MIELRPHQSVFIDDIRQALRSNQTVLAQAATGFGKTICAAFMATSAQNKGLDVMFTCHRQELIEQTSLSFNQVGIHHGFVAASMPYNPHAKVKIASVGTLQNRLEKVRPPRLLIVDEAHHCAAAGWARIVAWAKANNSKVVGLTATPWRLNGKGLGEYFETMVNGPTVAWLIENGYLSDYKVFAPSAPEMNAVHVRAGDFASNEAEGVMMDRVLIGDAVTHYQKHARGKKGIVFCVSVKHSERVAEQFRASGIMAIHLDAKTPKDERRKAMRAYADNHIQVVTNVDLFGEGFDASALAGKECPIEAVSLLRPTMSLSLFLQQVGRGLRPKPYPAVVLDHAGNFLRHGFPDDPIEWTLEDRVQKKRSENAGPDIPIRQCPACFFVHRPAPMCPGCGHVYEVASREVEERDGELQELSATERRRQRLQEQTGAQTLDDLIALAQKRGYKKPEKWAAHVYSARQVKRQRREGELI